MKKIVAILILTLVVLTGCNIGRNHTEEQYNKAKELAADFIKKNYEDIKHVEIKHVADDTNDTILVDGTADGAAFSVQVSVVDQDEMKVNAVGKGEGFPDRKAECVEHICE